MRDGFTYFASSRFVRREAVLEALRRCAKRLRAECPAVVAIYLFGSFATGTATPRSDADIVVEIAEEDPALREAVREQAIAIFAEAPVPAEVFVKSTREVEEGRRTGRGIAGAVAREGLRLA
jgi:predicted nucleotidyltransferase